MGDLTNNPVLSMTKGLNKILAGFNPDGTAKFAFTQHDNNPTVGTLLFPDVVITPKSGTIDELGNVYNNIGGARYMTAPSGRRYNIGEIPISNVDPLAKFYVEGTALAPAFNLAGKAGLYGFAKYAPNTKLSLYGRTYFINKELKIKNPFYENQTKVPLLNGYMYHTHDNPKYLGFVKNGNHYNLEHSPGALEIKNGKYISSRYYGNPENDRIWWDTNGHNSGQNVYVTRIQGHPINDINSLARPYGGLYSLNYRTTPQLNINSIVKLKYDPIGNTYTAYSPYRQITTNKMSIEELFTPEIQSSQTVSEPLTSLKFFERKPAKISEAERAGVPKGERNQPFKEKQLTEHVQGDEAVKMFKEYGGEPISEGSINGELLRKYVTEARERYGLTNNKNITDEEIAQALYKHSKELGGNTAAVNALGEPLLLFRGDTKAYTELRNNHHESGGTEDNVLGTLFLDRTGIGEGWGPDRYLYLSNKNGLVMAPYRTGIESESFSLLKPKFKDGYLYDGFDKGYISDKQISYPYWNYTTRSGEIIKGNKIASDNFADGTVNHLNAFVVRTPSVRDITNEVVVTGGKPGTPPFNWLIPKESRIGHNLHDVRLALNKAVVEEAKKHNQGLLKSDRGSYWRGEEHENYDYFALPDFNVQGAKHLLPYDLRIPRNWKDKNIYRGLIPLTTGYTLYNIFNQPQLQYLKQSGQIVKDFKQKFLKKK